MTLTNVDRLRTAAVVLRRRGLPGDEHAAVMLERCEPIALCWSEPYAAPFVPLLEAALHLAKAVTPEGEPVPPQPPQRMRPLVDPWGIGGGT